MRSVLLDDLDLGEQVATPSDCPPTQRRVRVGALVDLRDACRCARCEIRDVREIEPEAQPLRTRAVLARATSAVVECDVYVSHDGLPLFCALAIRADEQARAALACTPERSGLVAVGLELRDGSFLDIDQHQRHVAAHVWAYVDDLRATTVEQLDVQIILQHASFDVQDCSLGVGHHLSGLLMCCRVSLRSTHYKYSTFWYACQQVSRAISPREGNSFMTQPRVQPQRYYCGSCKNVPCCHMQNDTAAERPGIWECKCTALGIKQRDGDDGKVLV